MKKAVTEYYCTNIEEKEFLISQGFNYTFVKVIFDTKNTTTWKFTKTPELFRVLSEFYK